MFTFDTEQRGIGTQRLFLGSCVEVLPSVGRRYGFVIADPPYSRAGAAHTSTTTSAGMHSVLAQSDQFWEHWFCDQWRVIAAVCDSSACGMVFCDYRTIGALERAVVASESGWSVTQCAVWDRGSIGLGSPMRARHELIAFVRGPDFKWDGRKDIANVFRCDWPYGSHPNHPAEKPVKLLKEILQDFARGCVLDPFCGSASSGVAARELGLDWDGVEQDAITAKVAAERLRKRVRLFQDTVVRRRDGDALVYLMNRQRRGWGEYAIPHKDVAEIEVFYAVSVGDWQRDEHGEFAPARLVNDAEAA
jgi:DNA modification methylase